MKFKSLCLVALAATSVLFASCKKSNPVVEAVATIKTMTPGGQCVFQIDPDTVLKPDNMQANPFGEQTRTLILFEDKGSMDAPAGSPYQWRTGTVTAMQKILTKTPVDEALSTSPVEIYRSWMNSIEDDYLTVAFEGRWGVNGITHYINLETTADPYSFILKHDSNGDVDPVRYFSGLVAFDMEGLLPSGDKEEDVYIYYAGYTADKCIRYHYANGRFYGPYSATPEYQAVASSGQGVDLL